MNVRKVLLPSWKEIVTERQLRDNDHLQIKLENGCTMGVRVAKSLLVLTSLYLSDIFSIIYSLRHLLHLRDIRTYTNVPTGKAS